MIRLLCVDDEPEFLELTRSFLELEEGIEVSLATSVKEAEAMMAERRFDAVISDYQMPGMDGLEFLGRLRSAGFQGAFVLFTGKGREEVAIRALNEGADRYVQKGGDPRAQFADVAHALRTSVRQREALTTIKDREARLDAILRAAPTGIGVVSNRVLLEVNDRLCEMVGYQRTELVGRSARILYPSDEDFDFVGREKYAIMAARGTGTVETRWRRKDGQVLDVILSSTPIDPSDLGMGVVFTALDITMRKRMLLEIKDSEERWKFALEGSGDGVFDWDIENERVFFSPRWKQMLGYADMDMPNDSHEWRGRIHPEDRERVISELQAHLDGKTPDYRAEHRLRCQDGSYKWVLARGRVVARDGARALRMIGTHTDISDRKDSEQALLESERRFRSIFQSMNEGMAFHALVYDDAGRPVNYRVLEVNRRFEEIMGLTQEQVAGRPATEVYGVDEPPFLEAYAEVATSGKGREIDVFFAAKQRDFHVSVASFGKDQFATIFFDTTEQRRLERELKEREAALRLLTDNMEDMISQVSADNKIVYVSPSVRRRLGHAPERMLGRSVVEHVHPEDLDQVRSQFLAAVAAGEASVRLEYRYQAASGEFIWLESETHLFYEEGRRYAGCIFVSRDVSDRKRAETAAQLANNKLQLLNSVTRHDILNQVTVLRGYLEMDQRASSDPKMQEHLARMSRAVMNIQSQIDFMRDYQRMGEFAPDWQSVDGAFAVAAEAFHLDGIALQVEHAGLEVFADRLLEKVFHNLIDNSLRHGGGIGSVVLASECDDGVLRIVYQDDGVGVEDSEKSRIFEMGYGRHTGYGLFLAKEILELTGMDIEENGARGQGARFVIRVPRGAWRRRD